MPSTHLLVAVAPTPERQVFIKKAVSIARPGNAKVSLITLATDPELSNQFAAPRLDNLREVMQEETRE
ncbi:universal stress protein UspC, partial [Klebsiella pneumoniae]|nr:universal stress protein UspC [Klebsiella pneumoniae]